MMKKCLSLLLALCLGLLAGCGSAPSVDYPELPAVDTGALELESASNSSSLWKITTMKLYLQFPAAF